MLPNMAEGTLQTWLTWISGGSAVITGVFIRGMRIREAEGNAMTEAEREREGLDATLYILHKNYLKINYRPKGKT